MSPFLAAPFNRIVSDATADGVVVTVPIGNLKGHPLSNIIPPTDPVRVC